MLHELQPDADLIRERDALRRARAERRQDDSADGSGGEHAVGDEIVERGVGGDQLILAIGRYQVTKRLSAHIEAG